MKIVIDARMYGLENAGIGRYVMNLVNELGFLDQESQYFILLRKKYFDQLSFKSPNFKKVLADYHHYSVKEQVFLPIQLIKLKPDLVHFPHFNAPVLWWGRQVITIHDLIKHQSKGSETTTRLKPFYWFKFIAYRLLTYLTIKKATRVIVPSQYWQNKLIDRYSIQTNKVTVTYEGIDRIYQSKPKKFDLKKYQLKKPFIIYTGSLYPHKNVEKLVQAVSCYYDSNHSSKDLSLVIVCARNVFYKRFKKQVENLRAENFVNLVGFVPDEDLVALYRQAEAFVFPTLIEGFGLPGLEAMASSCPVLASKIPVLEEIYGNAAIYFDPDDEKDIAAKIKKIVSNQALKAKMRTLGARQVKKYSWQKMARQTLAVYQEAVGV